MRVRAYGSAPSRKGAGWVCTNLVMYISTHTANGSQTASMCYCTHFSCEDKSDFDGSPYRSTSQGWCMVAESRRLSLQVLMPDGTEYVAEVKRGEALEAEVEGCP